jgi:hypothetical protein
MKRYGNLWKDIVNMDTLRQAHAQARRGKSHYTAVKMVEKDVEGHLQRIQTSLINKTFTTSPYKTESRIEGGKLRTIYKLPYYPDRIVQHALISVIGPIFRRSLIRDTFQSLPQRGTSDARRRVQCMMKDDPQRYALQMDIRLYYPSIDNEQLKQIVRKKIKCPDTLWLLDNIIDSRQGLPIGNLTSQYLGNVYLYQFDWWVKQTLGAKYYFRYCDDLVLFSSDKKQLRSWRRAIEQQFHALSLVIKPNWQIIDVYKQGVDFVGYVFSPLRTKLRPAIAQRLKAHAATARSNCQSVQKSAQSLIAYKGWVMRANAKQLWRSHVPYGFIRRCDNLYKSNPLRGHV